MMKNFKNVLMGMVIGGLLVIGVNNLQKVNEIKILREITQSEEGIHLENGDKFTEFTDGSFCITNEENGTYIFQPVDLGDWNYEVDNIKDLENIVKTYLNIKNNGNY